jgi:hypothetical protein
MAGARFAYVVGIVILALIMLGVVAYGVNDFNSSLPSSCADFSGPSSLAPSECHKTNVIVYVVAVIVLGSGIGALWRKLGD